MTGFFILAEVPDQEVVIGVAGRFWRPDGSRCTELTSEEFPGFSQPGYAKAAWNFSLQSSSAETTVLSTETRIKCFGQEAPLIFWRWFGSWNWTTKNRITVGHESASNQIKPSGRTIYRAQRGR